jgi:hypothetical protein
VRQPGGDGDRGQPRHWRVGTTPSLARGSGMCRKNCYTRPPVKPDAWGLTHSARPAPIAGDLVARVVKRDGAFTHSFTEFDLHEVLAYRLRSRLKLEVWHIIGGAAQRNGDLVIEDIAARAHAHFGRQAHLNQPCRCRGGRRSSSRTPSRQSGAPPLSLSDASNRAEMVTNQPRR